MRKWTDQTDVTSKRLLSWIGLWSSTFSNWTRSYGKAYEHNGWTPRDHWLDEREKQAIIQLHFDHPLEGYRRLTYMMIDANIVEKFVHEYNTQRLHSAIGYVTQHDMLEGRQQAIFDERDRKLE